MLRHLEKANRSIQSVGIGEGQPVVALCASGLTEGFKRRDPHMGE
jgi:hypothetical protein